MKICFCEAQGSQSKPSIFFLPLGDAPAQHVQMFGNLCKDLSSVLKRLQVIASEAVFIGLRHPEIRNCIYIVFGIDIFISAGIKHKCSSYYLVFNKKKKQTNNINHSKSEDDEFWLLPPNFLNGKTFFGPSPSSSFIPALKAPARP